MPPFGELGNEQFLARPPAKGISHNPWRVIGIDQEGAHGVVHRPTNILRLLLRLVENSFREKKSPREGEGEGKGSALQPQEVG